VTDEERGELAYLRRRTRALEAEVAELKRELKTEKQARRGLSNELYHLKGLDQYDI
jgi:cell division protein FtsB